MRNSLPRVSLALACLHIQHASARRIVLPNARIGHGWRRREGINTDGDWRTEGPTRAVQHDQTRTAWGVRLRAVMLFRMRCGVRARVVPGTSRRLTVVGRDTPSSSARSRASWNCTSSISSLKAFSYWRKRGVQCSADD